MKINDILLERVYNAFTSTDKMKYADQVWAVLQQAYSKLRGGFGTASSLEELIEKSGLWKVVVRDGKVSAVNIYKDQHGRKSIASGTDGTPQGKKDFMMIKNEDVKFNRAWVEVSDAPEKILARMGAKPIPSKFAGPLTGKEILDYNSDGYHYTRLIAGDPHEKIIYGIVNLDSKLEEKLRNAGISIHELPGNIRKS
jgi:hypothetical protein